jgi:catechol 2,3-dioxygenase-like lactoylglutathione lyase family enzyme
MVSTEHRAQVTGIRTVAVPVRDQDRALAFWTGPLGMAVRLDVPLGAGRWIEVAPVGAATSVALVLAGAEDEVGRDTGIRLSSVDAEAAHAALRAAGADTDPDLLRWPGVPPMFVLRDPDGNRLTVIEA